MEILTVADGGRGLTSAKIPQFWSKFLCFKSNLLKDKTFQIFLIINILIPLFLMAGGIYISIHCLAGCVYNIPRLYSSPSYPYTYLSLFQNTGIKIPISQYVSVLRFCKL